MSDDLSLLRAKLNAETGRLAWTELQRHFARGVVIRVAAELDLVDVAVAVTQDDRTRVAGWLACGAMARAESDDARIWHERGSTFWAVVAAPWVLVQEIQPSH